MFTSAVRVTDESLKAAKACNGSREDFRRFVQGNPAGINIDSWTVNHQLALMCSPLSCYIGAAWSRGIIPNIPMRSVKADRLRMQNVSMPGANIVESSFIGACMDGAILSRAVITQTSFEKAGLRSVHFDRATLNYLDFAHADLSYSWLDSAIVNVITLQGGNAAGISFQRASLYGVNLTDVDAQAARFADSEISGSHFTGGSLLSADFSRARLRNTGFSRVNMQKIKFTDVPLFEHVSFHECDLRGADFCGTNLLGARFIDVQTDKDKPFCYDHRTKFPKGCGLNRRHGVNVTREIEKVRRRNRRTAEAVGPKT